MRVLHTTVPKRWLLVAFVITAMVLAFRVRDVLALNEGPEAEQLLEHAHAAYSAGEFDAALQLAEAAVEDSPGAPMVLVKASDYAFVLGMSLYEPREFWHIEAFEAGLDYSRRAHELEPANGDVHRAWAEGLLLAYLYEMPIDPEEVRASWESMPVDHWAEGVYRKTAIRIVSKPASDQE